MTDPELRALVADCLAVWEIAGRVGADDGVEIATATGCYVIRAAGAEQRPIRWYLEMPTRVAAGRPSRALPSIVAVIAALRNRLKDEAPED